MGPESEQVSSMVSSIWIVADNLGGYAGSTLGSLAYDSLGFEKASLIEVGALGSTVIIMLIIFFFSNICSLCNVRSQNEEENDAEKKQLLSLISIQEQKSSL